MDTTPPNHAHTVKRRFHPPQLALALAVGLALAIPTQFGSLWQMDGRLSMAMAALNFPGIISMLPFHGRFFPPEGYPGESIPRSLAMLAVQILVWYFVFSWFRAIRARHRNRAFPNPT